MPTKRRRRAKSTPPARPAADGAADAPPRQETVPEFEDDTTLGGELINLPDGTNYESCDDNDGPSEVLEDEQLIGVAASIVTAADAEPPAPAPAPERPRPRPLRHQSTSPSTPRCHSVEWPASPCFLFCPTGAPSWRISP